MPSLSPLSSLGLQPNTGARGLSRRKPLLCRLLRNRIEKESSSETQGQIVRAMESLNGLKNMARRKVKNGEESPWGQCLIRPVPNGRRRSAFWLGRKTQKFSGTNQKSERRRPLGTGMVRHGPQGLFSPFFTFLRALFLRPFRLSLAPSICPWVFEDEKELVVEETAVIQINSPHFAMPLVSQIQSKTTCLEKKRFLNPPFNCLLTWEH